MKLAIIAVCFAMLCLAAAVVAFKRCSSLKKELEAAKKSRDKLEKYNEKTEKDIASLHDGDAVDNAVDVLRD